MANRHKKWATIVATTAAGGLLVLGTGAPSSAAVRPGVTFYTGLHGTGTAVAADLAQVGVCQELSPSARSYFAATDRNVEVFFNADCRAGAPGESSDLVYVTGTLNSGDFPWTAVSYRVRADAR
ncbi:hypothetical protein ACPXCE_00915 [Streptomyces sp. DT24]|uniref:hypothetical protein n=1 Tax=unclassified Streptomyces TaxID=2593676 RepID=UPI0023B8A5EB|nr:hypothetical protein [Streptomyces sp. AM 4-1-1]WEH36579.1 hypothetical protein PZB75_26420 [Streptomyces sp. AM 4-1-1]